MLKPTVAAVLKVLLKSLKAVKNGKVQCAAYKLQQQKVEDAMVGTLQPQMATHRSVHNVSVQEIYEICLRPSE